MATARTFTTQPDSLLYAFVTDVSMLSAAGDTPVWPVRHEPDLRALTTVVRVFGGTAAPCAEPTPRRLGGKEAVVALGPHVAEEAALYAHLTIRRCVAVSSLEELSELPAVAVVVTTEDWVSERLLEILCERTSRASATGLIYAPTTARLRQQVLVRSAAAYLCRKGLAASPAVHRIDVLPATDIGHAVSPHWQIVGARATAEDATDALSAGAGVLTLVSHSDGIDSPLSQSVVLCAIDGARADAPVADAPACIVTGMCHRRREPIEAALASGALIDPRVIEARIVVMDVCWGLLPPLDVIHPAWGLGRRLIDNAAIGAFVTCWEIVRSSPQLIAPLVDAIAGGKPLGESLTEALASERWQKFGRRMCLVGDPRVQLPRPPSPLVLADVLPPPLHEDRSARAGAVEFLRAYVTLARQNPEGTYDDRSTGVLAAIDAYQQALWTGRGVEGATDAPGPRLRETFMSFALGRFSVAYPIWQQFADDWIALPPRECYGCRRRALAVEFRLCVPGASARRVTNCQSCGTIEDVPVATDVTFSVSPDGELQLHGGLPSGRCVGGLMLETSMPDDRRVFPWPTDTHGALARAFRASPPWPRGPLRVAVLIVSETCDLIALGRHGRGERLVSVSA